jgi:uncharacterized protein (DUF2126 family)
MNVAVFATELAMNRAAYERLKVQIGTAPLGHYAAIANGRLITIAPTFDDAVAAVDQLQPPPQHFLVFPVDEEPAFEIIDDFVGC